MERYNLKSSLQFGETLKSVSDSDYRRLRDNYDALLKQPLKLEMFIPCDENGNVLNPSDVFKSCEKGFLYGKAKERLLFKGFEFSNSKKYLTHKTSSLQVVEMLEKGTIEDLVSDRIELTENAIKQIGL